MISKARLELPRYRDGAFGDVAGYRARSSGKPGTGVGFGVLALHTGVAVH